METPTQVYVVDDDASIREVVKLRLEQNDFQVSCYESGEAFLSSVSIDARGCVLVDLRMPGMSGDELQRRVTSAYPLLKIVIVSGAADVALAVKVMENGAITLLEKPFSAEALVSVVQNALARSQESTEIFMRSAGLKQHLSTLTDDERRVMSYMVRGISNKRVANELEISSRTLDRRRAAVLTKMRASSIAELVNLLYGVPYQSPPVLRHADFATPMPTNLAPTGLS